MSLRLAPSIWLTLFNALLAAALALGLAAPAWAQTTSSLNPTAPPAGANVTTLSRQNLAVMGTLAAGASANFTVDYEPQMEGTGKLAPWLLRMYFSAPGASANQIGFRWVDQTSNAAVGSTTNNSGTSVAPSIGGNATDVPAGTDTSTIQQAVLSAAAPGNFAITVFDGANVPANYTLQLMPLLGGVLESGINPSPKPVQVS